MSGARFARTCPDCGADPGRPHGQTEYGRCDGYELAASGKGFVVPAKPPAPKPLSVQGGPAPDPWRVPLLTPSPEPPKPELAADPGVEPDRWLRQRLVSVRLTEEEHELLVSTARREKRSVGEVIRSRIFVHRPIALDVGPAADDSARNIAHPLDT